MKRTIISLFALMVVMAAMAIPAHPKPMKVQQPDGSFITIQLHGDEWRSFNTTADGYSVVKDQRGYYVYADLQDGKLKPTTQVAHDVAQRSATEKAFLANTKKMLVPQMEKQRAEDKKRVEDRQRKVLAKHRSQRATDYDNFRGLVVLVQFNDREFSRSDYATIANDMMNAVNYTGYDSEVYTGSVRDYFSDNSGGKFLPQFDVVGPVTVDYSQYDGRSQPKAIAAAAIDLVDSQYDVDFSQYDGDSNGDVDLVYFIIAGNGANYSGNDSRLWWPHRSVVYNNGYVIKDGVYIWDYASSVEIYGWTSTPGSLLIDGIGTICHEFSHVLGLPDFYDADYEESGGQSIHPDKWSVMAGGSYENNARTPVGYSLYERYSVGFTDEPEKITAKGAYTLEPLYLNQRGYRIDSPVANEFFLFENRRNDGSFKWDEYLPGSGLLVHRVDQTDMSIWSSNAVNNDPTHNYYEVVRACGTGMKGKYDVFPGAGGVTELDNNTTPANLKTWSGEETMFGLYSIHEDGSNIAFIVTPSGDGPVRPTDVAAHSITGSTATITWTGANDNYNVRYRTAAISGTAFYDDFESGLGQWTIYTEGESSNGTGWSWANIDSGTDSGNCAAGSWSWNGNPYHADNWLITPQVVLGNELRFWVLTSPSWPDKYEVLLSTTGNAIDNFTVELKAMAAAPNNGQWNEVIIDLSAYTGQLGYIAIHHVDYDMNYLYIDDFTIYNEAAPAGAWQTVSATQENVQLTGLTENTSYEVQVQSETADGTSEWSTAATFTTNSLVVGDANGVDGVTITDAVAVVNNILGNPSSNFSAAAANVNGDLDEHGEPNITITDAVGVVNIILNNSGSSSAPAMAEPETSGQNPE
jgi:M6 family metalloprotease-like protein